MGKTRGDVEFYDGTTNKSLVTELHRIDEALKHVAYGMVYGVAIDLSISHPNSSVTYTDGAAGFTPAKGNNGNYVAGSLDEHYPWNAIRPCLLKQGKVVGYLNKNDFSKFENGSSADITSGSSGDVMIEIPHFYYKISKVGTILYVKVSNVMQDGFTDWAFSYKGVVKDKFYVGAYLGYVDGDNKLRSLSGKKATAYKKFFDFRTAARANGAGYEQIPFNKLTALQVLYLLLFKSLDSQTALGKGYVGGESVRDTGVTDAKGMNYGTTGNSTANDTVKCLGIEDFWGNLQYGIEGLVTRNEYIRVADGNFNNSADGYIPVDKLINFSVSGEFYTDVAGDNVLAFIPKKGKGSETTYFCDIGNAHSAGGTNVSFFGGQYSYGSSAGAFNLDCMSSMSSSYWYLGARLTYCG